MYTYLLSLSFCLECKFMKADICVLFMLCLQHIKQFQVPRMHSVAI